MLIIDMPMPRNCDECVVNFDCAFCGITGSAFYGNTQMPNFAPDEQKLPDCPIVCVLPKTHGRLIDASTVIGVQQDEEDNDVPVTVDDYLGLQFPVPTIVPATERIET